MIRFGKIRVLSLVLILSLLPLTFGAAGCGEKSQKEQLEQSARNAERVGRVARQVQPLFQSLIDGQVIPADAGAEIIKRTQFIVETAPKLARAFRANTTADIVTLSAELIRVAEQVIEQDTLLIPAGIERTTIMGVLVAGDIALGIIADNIVEAGGLPQFAHVVQAAAKKDVETIKRYAKKPRYRARDAKTGKFVSLEYARKHPETTVIERVK